MDAHIKIPFNKPFLTGEELNYIRDAIQSGKISGNGIFTRKCQDYFEKHYKFKKTLLTTSCTHALEMAAMLIDLHPGDEVIMPSFTFVSTANAFILNGARIVFADSGKMNPNLDVESVEALITEKTRAIVPVHYAGIACDMDPIIELAEKHDLYIVEDAAQSIDSTYKDKALGGIGHFGTFSFHETKNLNAGEGGLLSIRESSHQARAEIIWEKGTNRSAFFRGEVDKYNWVDKGSSYLPSEIIAAFLYAQLEHLDKIQEKRIMLWNSYYENLKGLADRNCFSLPFLPGFASNNGHMFYIVLPEAGIRTALINHLKERGILSVFHYQSLHKSPFFKSRHDGRELPNSDMYSDCLLRLPMYYELEKSQLTIICEEIYAYFNS